MKCHNSRTDPFISPFVAVTGVRDGQTQPGINDVREPIERVVLIRQVAAASTRGFECQQIPVRIVGMVQSALRRRVSDTFPFLIKARQLGSKTRWQSGTPKKLVVP